MKGLVKSWQGMPAQCVTVLFSRNNLPFAGRYETEAYLFECLR